MNTPESTTRPSLINTPTKPGPPTIVSSLLDSSSDLVYGEAEDMFDININDSGKELAEAAVSRSDEFVTQFTLTSLSIRLLPLM